MRMAGRQSIRADRQEGPVHLLIDTVEVTGSIPASPTNVSAGQGLVSRPGVALALRVAPQFAGPAGDNGDNGASWP